MLRRLWSWLSRPQRCEFSRCTEIATDYDALLDVRTCLHHKEWPETVSLTLTVSGHDQDAVEAARAVIDAALAEIRRSA